MDDLLKELDIARAKVDGLSAICESNPAFFDACELAESEYGEKIQTLQIFLKSVEHLSNQF